MTRVQRLFLVSGLLAVAAGAADDLSEEDRAQLAAYFGFGEMQIYKYKPGIANLQLADLNGDGRTDIAFWNHWENRIELLFQPAAEDGGGGSNGSDDLARNEIADRGDMRRESISVANRVESLAVGDLTADGVNDLVYFGEPRELVILPGHGDGSFGERIVRRVPKGEPQGGGLALGDFNADGRLDVALRGEQQLLVFPQNEDGGLGTVERLFHDATQPGLLLAGDVDGDGRDDLILGVDDEAAGMLLFRQTARGLGPMEPVRIPRTRSITVAPRAGAACEVFSIESATGRLTLRAWGERDTDGDWTPVYHSLPFAGRATRRPLAVGDVDGDGLADALVADPESGQFVLHRGTQGARLAPGVVFPGLLGVRELQVVAGGAQPEVYCLSTSEKQLAVSRFEDGRLSFPRPLVLEGEPQAFRVGALQDGGVTLAVLLKDPARVVLLDAQRRVTATIELGALPDDPEGLRFFDLDQDGLTDLLVFVAFSKPIVLRQTGGGVFEQLEAGGAAPSRAEIDGYATADVDDDGKPELLLAQKNLARALRIEDGRWIVVDQYNPDTTDAALRGLAWIDAGAPRLVAYDETQGDLLIWTRRSDATFEVARRVRVGAFQSPTLQSARWAGAPVLLLADTRQLAELTESEATATLVEALGYESDLDEAWTGDSVVCDLNADGIRDVALIDMRRARIEVLTTLPSGDLVRATHFQVFQGKSFSQQPEARGEPRQVLAGDVTGDGRDDLVVIVHDRLIVYPGS